MTTARNVPNLARVVARTRYVLLDFDGPICKVFTDPTAATVTARLVEVIDAHGVDTPQQVVEAGPHDLLHHAATVSPALARDVEEALREVEVEAAATAASTPGADELFEACQQTGRPVAVVSNNAAEAVTAYLERMKLTGLVAHIQGRDPADPSLMKPNPHPINMTRRALCADVAECVLIGDSASDMQAAHAAGIRSIGYANKQGKRQRLANGGADSIVEFMGQLALVLTTTQSNPRTQ